MSEVKVYIAHSTRRGAEDFFRYDLRRYDDPRLNIRFVQREEDLYGHVGEGQTLWLFDKLLPLHDRIRIQARAEASRFVIRYPEILRGENICRYCFEPIKDGEPRHTARFMHYACYEKIPRQDELDMKTAVKQFDAAAAKLQMAIDRLSEKL